MPGIKNYDPQDVIADINYFPATGKTIETTSWKRRYLGVGDESTRAMTIHAVRGLEQEFELDRNGFQFVKLPDKVRNTDDDKVIEREYHAELEELAKKM